MSIERLREPVSSSPSPEYIREKAEEGWVLTALEWERESNTGHIDAGRLKEEIAAGLNREGHMTRQQTAWTQSSVFYMLPRLIEAAPQIFSSVSWRERRSEVKARMAELRV